MHRVVLNRSESHRQVVARYGKKMMVATTALCLMAPFVLASSEYRCRVSQGHQAEKTRAPGLVTKQNRQVVLMPNGTLTSFFLQNADGRQAVWKRSSTDNGRSWSEEREGFQLPADPEALSGLWALVDNNGKVHLFFFSNAGIWYSKPNASASGWQDPKGIYTGRVGVLRSAMQMRSGRLLLPFYYEVKRDFWDGSEKGLDRFTYMGNYVTSALYSDDGGDTWKQTPEIIKIPTPSLNQNGAVDPVVLEMKDGRIWMLVANQRGWLYEAFSKDGVTWSENHPSRFISSEAPGSLTRLPDGRIVLLWNSSLRFPYLHGGMYVLHAAISDDEGKSWLGFREIYRDPHRNEPEARGAGYGTGFPTATGTAEGKILVSTGQGKSEITMLLDPKWLYETRQKDDFSQGLDDWSVFGTKGVELIPDPEKPGARVLGVRKAETEWPAAAVWNFPAAKKGQVRVKLRLNKGFLGAHLSLTDHFSIPFDLEAEFNALFNLNITPQGQLGETVKLEPERWYEVAFDWDTAARQCSIRVDGRKATVLPQLRLTDSGPDYLRLHAVSEHTGDAGFLVQYVEADAARK